MPDRTTLVDTLRTTSSMLKAIRKMVIDAGCLQEMQDIDSLINVAQNEADRRAIAVKTAAKKP